MRFTFHYASTLSNLVRDIVVVLWHLHSTMLLLYLQRGLTDSRVLCIYIPLCFYFIADALFIFDAILKFTFHYASTLSVIAIIDKFLLSAFTFHYASTLSYGAVKYHIRVIQFTFHYASTLSLTGHAIPASSDKIYIPLCFYFIVRDTDPGIRALYLHSTMLLLYRRRAGERGQV